jgi:hypothetical protein
MKRNSALRDSVLRRTAGEIRGYNRTMKVLAALLGMLTVVTSLLFVVAALYTESGSFTVTIDKVEMTKYALTLSESPDMSKMTSNLNAEIHESITNIAEESIPANVDMVDGVHNGQNYIAYTFYLQNRGEYEFPVEYSVNMTNITSGLDEAIRLKLYVNGEPTVYAKTRSDGTGPEKGTVEFYSSNVMARGRIDILKPGEIVKFTVVLWIEGNDPDCLDPLIGGQIKAEMNINAVH